MEINSAADDDIDDSGSCWGESCTPASIPEIGRIVTLSQEMDALFMGTGPSPAPAGVPLATVTEVCGPPGSGKSTLAMQLSIDVQMPHELGGAGGGAVYIDTEGGFFPERLRELAEALSSHVVRKVMRLGGPSLVAAVAPAELLRNVRVMRATTVEALAAAVEALPRVIKSEESARAAAQARGRSTEESPDMTADAAEAPPLPLLPIRLVVIDSVALPLRQGLATLEASSRVSAIATLGAALHALAARTGVAVVIVNHLTTKMGGGGGGGGGGERAAAAFAAAASTLPAPDALALALDFAPPSGADTTSRLIPALGDVWARVPSTRLWLDWIAGRRVAAIDKSIVRPEGMRAVAFFDISAAGVRKAVTKDVTRASKSKPSH
jgi:RecA/RadA recombinase